MLRVTGRSFCNTICKARNLAVLACVNSIEDLVLINLDLQYFSILYSQIISIKSTVVKVGQMFLDHNCEQDRFFHPQFSWYPIGSYSLVSSLQLPYRLREAKVESRASSETQPNQAALLLDTMPT